MKKYFFTRTEKVVAIFLALFFLGSLQGCMYYYKVQTLNKVSSREMREFDSLKKYLILHRGDSAWHLSPSGITDNSIVGNLSVLPDYHWKFKTTRIKGGNRYKKGNKYVKNEEGLDESFLLKEVHLYLQDSLISKISVSDSIKIDCSSIRKAEIYIKAKGRTAASWAIPIVVGVPVLAGIVVAILIVAVPKDGDDERGGSFGSIK